MGVKVGDIVKVEYEGRLETGEIFDSSQHGEHSHPIEFTVGNHEVIKGFEDNVLGMEIDSEREFSIAPEDAYGEHKEELVREFPRSQIPLDKEPEAGMVLGMMTPDGRQLHATIIKVDPETITLDLNHPLAGKRLIFKIKLIDLRDKKDMEAEEQEVREMEEEALNGNGTESADEKELEDKLEEVIEEKAEEEFEE